MTSDEQDWRPRSGAAPWRLVRSGATLASPRLRELRDYWLSLAAGRVMPAREDLDPLDIPRLLPNLMLVDVFHDPQRFRLRLVGTRLTELAKRDSTGRWMDASLYGDNTERVLLDLRACADTGAPVASLDTAPYLENDWIRAEALLLPLGRQDGTVDMILEGIEVVAGKGAGSDGNTVTLLDWRR
ncbi:PAS domain-containing protein [Thalassobaculum sp.]|uniref:PAS domain-containing protein n=1 Tax=Thalassobaculum sp. TaxID=2022740 RepID=UPI0032EADB1A